MIMSEIMIMINHWSENNSRPWISLGTKELNLAGLVISLLCQVLTALFHETFDFGCVLCLGYYCGSNALPEPSGTCWGGYYCPYSADRADYIMCPAGSYCTNGSSFYTACPSGRFLFSFLPSFLCLFLHSFFWCLLCSFLHSFFHSFLPSSLLVATGHFIYSFICSFNVGAGPLRKGVHVCTLIE